MGHILGVNFELGNKCCGLLPLENICLCINANIVFITYINKL